MTTMVWEGRRRGREKGKRDDFLGGKMVLVFGRFFHGLSLVENGESLIDPLRATLVAIRGVCT